MKIKTCFEKKANFIDGDDNELFYKSPVKVAIL